MQKPAITVTTDHDHTTITVQDNGGIPESEQLVIQNQHETQLTHSSGLGLWLTYWIVSSSGGTLTIDSAPGAGTTISLAFDRPPSNE